MSARYFIQNGQTISPVMPMDWDGCLVSFLFYGPTGLPVTVTGLPVVSRSLYEVGDIFNPVQPFAVGEWRFNGPSARVKVSLAGVTGFTTYKVLIWRTGEPLPMVPDGAFTGLRAMTSQTYIEANVKNGGQFYIQHAVPSLAATTGVSKLLFTTGAKKVLIKGRELYGIAERVQIQLFRQPTAPTPGGTAVAVQNFNDDILPVPVSTVSVLSRVTTTADGTAWGSPQRLFGQSGVGQRTGSGLAPSGDRILRPNSRYLVVFSNLGSGTADLDYFLTWYEGGADLPIAPQ